MKHASPVSTLIARNPKFRHLVCLAGGMLLSSLPAPLAIAQEEVQLDALPTEAIEPDDTLVVSEADPVTDDGLNLLTITTVVSSKTPKVMAEVLPSVDTVSGGELKARQLYQLEQVLSFSPGVSIVQTGQAGGVSSLFIRGMESNHTVVMLNGRRLAPGLAGLYNLELLDTMWLDSVELQRGPVSSLYGSDALAGALDLRMTDARTLLPGASATSLVEGGSFNTIRAGQQFKAKEGPLGVVLDLSFHDTENDQVFSDFQNLNLRTNVALEIGDRTWIDVLGYYQDSELQVPGSTQSFFFPETQLNDNESWLLSPRFSIQRDDWDFSTFYSHNRSELEATQDVFFLDSLLEQESNEVEAQLNLHPSDNATFTLGGGWFEHEFTRMPLIPGPFNTASAQRYSYWSLYGQADLDLPANLNLLGSGRYDGHDSFDSKATYSVQLTHTVEATDTQVFGKIATGYKAPSGQDFVFLPPTIDPTTLEPEESRSWEAGVRQFLPEDFGSVAVTYFQADIENLVDSFGFPAIPTTVDTETQGIELEILLTPGDHWQFFANYTWLEAHITDGFYFGGFAGGPGDRLPRRPEHTFSGGVSYQTLDWRLGAEFISAFGRLDSPGVTLDDYAVARVFGSVFVNDQLEIFARMENVFDESFETTRGYEASGFGAYGGIRFTF